MIRRGKGMDKRMMRTIRISQQTHPLKQRASVLLALMVMSGLACPCRGLTLLAEWSALLSPAEACEVSSCCQCCPHEPEEKKVPEPMHDCSCLSGCCDPYILPVVQGVALNPADLIPLSLPSDVQPQLAWLPDLAARRLISDSGPPLYSFGTLLPALSTLLI